MERGSQNGHSDGVRWLRVPSDDAQRRTRCLLLVIKINSSRTRRESEDGALVSLVDRVASFNLE